MTQRPGSARGGLTIAQAQDLILAQALADRTPPPESRGASPAQPFALMAGPNRRTHARAYDDVSLRREYLTPDARIAETDPVVGGLAKNGMWDPRSASAPVSGQDTVYRPASGIDPQRQSYIDHAVIRGDETVQMTPVGNPHNPRLKREWVRAKGIPWPRDPVTGRDYDVGHKRALADGGTNTLDNIEPIHPDAHRAQHMANGDPARFARRQWIARAFGGRVARGLGALDLIPNITGLLSGRIRTDSWENFASDVIGVPSPEDMRQQNEELRKRYFPNTKPGDWVA
jgi:hypothetical protein